MGDLLSLEQGIGRQRQGCATFEGRLLSGHGFSMTSFRASNRITVLRNRSLRFPIRQWDIEFLHVVHFGGAGGAGSMLRMAAMRQPSGVRAIRNVLHMRLGGAPARPAIS